MKKSMEKRAFIIESFKKTYFIHYEIGKNIFYADIITCTFAKNFFVIAIQYVKQKFI